MEKIQGYVLEETIEATDYGGEVFVLRHEKTGLKVYFLKNKDEEKFFSYTVYTPSENSKGCAHIIEHTVLAGSKKYPVKDPFFILAKNSPSTYLNALTAPDRTFYPASSTVEKDLSNIFEVYTDAVFSPLLRKETFMQEGIRISEKGGSKHFEGVVFSEMKGFFSSHDDILSYAIAKGLFPKCAYKYESGGIPEEICTLTYEEYLSFYKKWYVPENISLFLYGNIEGEKYLRYLDKNYLSEREKGERIERVVSSPYWKEPRANSAVSPATSDSEKASVVLSWLLGPSGENGNSIFLSLLTDILLGSSAAPLYFALLSSSLGEDVSSESGMTSSFRNLLFTVGLSGADEKKQKEIESFILESLKKIVDHGIDKIIIEAALRRAEFSYREALARDRVGLNLFFRIEKALTFSLDFSHLLSPVSLIEKIRRDLRKDERLFEKWIEKNLLCNSHRLLTVVTREKDYERKRDEDIEKKLGQREYLKREEESFFSFQKMKDKEEDIKKVPKIKREEIHAEKKKFSDIEMMGNIEYTPLSTEGIVYTDIYLDVSDFTYEELDALNLFTKAITLSGVKGEDYVTVQNTLRYQTGGFSFFLDSLSDVYGKERVFLVLRIKTLPSLQEEALNTLKDIIFYPDIDKSVIERSITEIKTEFESNIVYDAYHYASSLSSSFLTPSLYINERLSGVTCWKTILNLAKKDIVKDIKNAALKALDKNRLSVHVSSVGKDKEKSLSIAENFSSLFPSLRGVGESAHSLPPSQSKYTAFLIPSSVSSVSVSSKASRYLDQMSVGEKIFSTVLSSTDLWNRIREKNGAYGAYFSTSAVEGFWSFYSYRDPRIDGTITDFLSSLEKAPLTNEMIDDAVIVEVSKTLKPIPPSSLARLYKRRKISLVTEDLWKKRLGETENIKLSDVEKVRDNFLSSLSDARTSVLSSKESILKSEKPFTVICLDEEKR